MSLMTVNTADRLDQNKNELPLLEFLTAGDLPYRILVLEDTQYLPVLRQMFPHGELWCVVADASKEHAPELDNMGIKFCCVDYVQCPLPLQENYFDYILSEECLTAVVNPQDIAAGMGKFLKDTGYFIFSFTNIRYWRVLKKLMEGHFYYLVSRAFTKAEMMKLMSASFYKDAALAPIPGSNPPDGLIEKLLEAGFENSQDDLLTKKWMVRAAKFTPEIMELKRLYTPEIRRELATLLRRLEYGIAPEFSREALRQLCQNQGIFASYLASFMGEMVIHINDLLHWLSLWQTEEATADLWQDLLTELPEAFADTRKQEQIIKWQQGNPEPLHDEPVPELHMPEGTKIAFISCVNDEEQYQEAQLYLSQLRLPSNVEAEVIGIREADSMCQGYNLGAKETEAKYKVYLHQDVLIVNKNFIYDLLKIFQDSSVGAVGMIGARKLPASGVWWDAMRTYGKVLHACIPECSVISKCMEPPEPWIEVEGVDGLLVATQVDLPWREDLFGGFHFYEISMCKEMQRQGYKVVVPHQKRFWCIHMPHEKPLDPSYKIYQQKFLQEYGDELEPEI